MDLVIDNSKKMIRIDSKYQRNVVDLLSSYGINISLERWRSQANAYALYESEPWLTDGFDYEMYFDDESEKMFDYAVFLITTHLERVEHLERCLAEV